MAIKCIHNTEKGIQAFFSKWNGRTLFIDEDNIYNPVTGGVYHYCTDNTSSFFLSETMIKVLRNDFKIAHQKCYLACYADEFGKLQHAVLHTSYQKGKYIKYLSSSLGYTVYLHTPTSLFEN